MLVNAARRCVQPAVLRTQAARSFSTVRAHNVYAVGNYLGRRTTSPTMPITSNIAAQRRLNSQKTERPFWNAPVLTYEEVKKRSEQPSPNSYIIDVREPDEVAQGSIPSSVSIPLSGFTHSLSLPDIEFEAKHGFKKPAKDEEVVFYCRSGKRSATASDEAKHLGFKNVKNYSGSWLDWVAKEQEHKNKNSFDDD